MKSVWVAKELTEPVFVETLGRHREIHHLQSLPRLTVESVTRDTRKSVCADDLTSCVTLNFGGIRRRQDGLRSTVERHEQAREMTHVRRTEERHPCVEIGTHTRPRRQHVAQPRGSKPVADAVEARRDAPLIAEILTVRCEERITLRSQPSNTLP